MKIKEKSNAKQLPKVYYARHMHDGVCGYGDETIYIGNDAISKMSSSFEGKPVYVFHNDLSDEERLEQQEDLAAGHIIDTFRNEHDGWFWSKIIITKDDGHDAVKKGWAVSNAYIPSEFSGGGERFNVAYDREFINGEFTHLAIVPNPRYEDACIMSKEEYRTYCADKKAQIEELQNSKHKKKGKLAMKLFKKEKKEVTTVDENTMVELQNDDGTTTEILLSEMVNAVKNAAEADDEEKINMDEEIEVGNEKMSIKELSNRYQSMCSDKEKEKEKEKEDDEAKNADEEKEKSNSDHFKALKNAEKKNCKKALPSMRIDRLAAGKAKY